MALKEERAKVAARYEQEKAEANRKHEQTKRELAEQQALVKQLLEQISAPKKQENAMTVYYLPKRLEKRGPEDGSLPSAV